MKKRLFATCFAAIVSAALSIAALAQIGSPYIHDPSTIVECDGKYYTFGTGGGGLISEDGWSWHSGAVRPGGGVAPDAIKIGDRYLVVYATTDRSNGLRYRSRVYAMWNKTLDPDSPDFKYSEPMDIGGSNGYEDCDGIDPGLMMGPDGRLWLVYGTYFGYTRVVELNPKNAIPISEPVDVALSCEAGEMTYHDGWYYLLATHGTCCSGVNSTYEIIVGRSKSPTGPYYDHIGRDMIHGGGKLLLASEPRRIGAGHFGRFIVSEGVEKMSFHFEGDLDRSGRSVLAIRPLMWKDGWPVAGEPFENGKYSIVSERRGYTLELAVNNVPLNGGRGMSRGGDAPVAPMADQKLEDVIGTWPEGQIGLRIGPQLFRPHQTWEITELTDVEGYLGGAYCKITIAGTSRALAATADKEVTTVAEFTGAPEQLWRIDRLTDGTYRIMPKAVPGTSEELVLTAVADSTPSLGAFDPANVNCKWSLKALR
jgi:arabinan endo-1,5-alpha-L-arabinosidase